MTIWGNPPKFKSDPPKKGKVIQPEDIAGVSEGSQQKAIMVWANQNSIQYPQLKYLFHIPNGGSRNIREAVELKAQGVKAGVPDLFLPWPNANYWRGCFIELKVGKNKTSLEQNNWIDYLKDYYYVEVCYSWIKARDALIAYLEGKL